MEARVSPIIEMHWCPRRYLLYEMPIPSSKILYRLGAEIGNEKFKFHRVLGLEEASVLLSRLLPTPTKLDRNLLR